MKKVLIAALFLSLSTSAFASCYSDGIRVGTIQKFSQKGYVNKSWEGELVMQGVKSNGQGANITNIWAFSVTDPEVAKAIDNATMSGKPVALKYCQSAPFVPNMTTDTSYLIIKAVERQ